MMERGLQELKFVDFRRRGNHFECTTVAAIKQLCDKVSVTFILYVSISVRKAFLIIIFFTSVYHFTDVGTVTEHKWKKYFQIHLIK